MFSDSRAPISLLKVKHDQPVELRIAERRNEQWTRQPPPPQGPFAGSGHRLGAGSPFPEPASSSFSSSSATASATGASMPGALPSGTSTAIGGEGGGNSAGGVVEFEVDRNEPTTQVQIRLRNGERSVRPFRCSCHTCRANAVCRSTAIRPMSEGSQQRSSGWRRRVARGTLRRSLMFSLRLFPYRVTHTGWSRRSITRTRWATFAGTSIGTSSVPFSQ